MSMWFISERGKMAGTVLIILPSGVILRDGLQKLRI
jgi:hypothetical protein